MSNTPRTDAYECENFPSTEPIVSAKRCGQLERELAAAKAEQDVLVEALRTARDVLAHAQHFYFGSHSLENFSIAISHANAAISKHEKKQP